MVVVIGDSFAEWLAYGLEEVFAETPQIGILRKTKQDLGLVRDDQRSDAPEWTQAIKDLLPATDKPDAIVVMLGLNDRAALRERPLPAKETAASSDNAHPAPAPAAPPRPPPSVSYEFHTDKWAELYSKRIDDMIAALKTRGVPIIWVGLPAIRGTKSTSDMGHQTSFIERMPTKPGSPMSMSGMLSLTIRDATSKTARILKDKPAGCALTTVCTLQRRVQ